MKQILQINDINEIEYNDEIIDIMVEGNKLKITTNLSSTIIDNNFNELEARINDIESQLKLKYDGQIKFLLTEVNMLKNK